MIHFGGDVYPGSIAAAFPDRPATESTVHIADENGRFLPPGEIGSVWFAQPGAAVPEPSTDGSTGLAGAPGWGTVDYCRSRLAHFTCPRSVDIVDTLPRNDAGKIRLVKLRSRYLTVGSG